MDSEVYILSIHHSPENGPILHCCSNSHLHHRNLESIPYLELQMKVRVSIMDTSFDLNQTGEYFGIIWNHFSL